MKNTLSSIAGVVLLLLLCLALFAPCAFAHPGDTDANGGHHDYGNVSGLGDYHYHHGHRAHLHENGVCPYGYDDKTDHSSHEASPKSSSSSDGGKVSATVNHNSGSNEQGPDVLYIIIVTAIIAFFTAWIWVPLGSLIWRGASYNLPYKKRRRAEEEARKAEMERRRLEEEAQRKAEEEARLAEEEERRRIEEEERRKIWEQERIPYVELYQGKDPLKLAGAPEGVFVDEHGNPSLLDDKGNDALFYFYLSYDGRKYHTAYCYHAYKDERRKQFYFDFVGTSSPCKVCKPKVKQEDIKWYKEFKKIYDIKRKYDII